MRRVLPCILATQLLVANMGAAPATQGPKSDIKAPEAPNKPYQIGKASWYGKPFHGKSTASGELYDMFQFTAAHRQLPLGTWVKVTNLVNGRYVMVRINDRGPIAAKRIIDLSLGAARRLGLEERGVARVRLDLVAPAMLASARGLAGLP